MDLRQIIRLIIKNIQVLKILVACLLVWNAILSGMIIKVSMDEHNIEQQAYQISTEDNDINVDDLELIEDLGELQFDK